MFQIFAQLIELHAPPLPPLYMQLFKPLLAPLFWERAGNVPALTRLLRAYLAKAGPAIVEQGLLEVRCCALLWLPPKLRILLNGGCFMVVFTPAVLFSGEPIGQMLQSCHWLCWVCAAGCT